MIRFLSRVQDASRKHRSQVQAPCRLSNHSTEERKTQLFEPFTAQSREGYFSNKIRHLFAALGFAASPFSTAGAGDWHSPCLFSAEGVTIVMDHSGTFKGEESC